MFHLTAIRGPKRPRKITGSGLTSTGAKVVRYAHPVAKASISLAPLNEVHEFALGS